MPDDMTSREVRIIKSEMSADMARDALKHAGLARLAFTTKFEMAKYMKETFDRMYAPNWECLVGPPTFAAYGGRHDPHCFICFDMGNDRFILKKNV